MKNYKDRVAKRIKGLKQTIQAINNSIQVLKENEMEHEKAISCLESYLAYLQRKLTVLEKQMEENQ